MTLKELIENATLHDISVYTQYVPFEKKITTCERIINATSYITIKDEKIFKKNTPARNMLYTLNLIGLYFNVDIDYVNVLDEYNLLEKSNMKTTLLSLIPKNEMQRFDTMMAMIESDFEENNRSMIGYIDDKIASFKIVADAFIEGIKNNPDVINAINNIGVDKVNE